VSIVCPELRTLNFSKVVLYKSCQESLTIALSFLLSLWLRDSSAECMESW